MLENIKLTEEEVPSFALHFSFQSNMAFMVAVFIMVCALGWALRDHRRRLLEMATEEQEDHLYLAVLGILFCVCTLGSYYAFNRTSQSITSGPSISRNILIDELYRTFLDLQGRWAPPQNYVPYTPDLPVKMPIPKRNLLDEAMEHKHDPAYEFRQLSTIVLFLCMLFAIWYFYPRSRPEISPPVDYMSSGGKGDLKGGTLKGGASSKKSSKASKPGTRSGTFRGPGSTAGSAAATGSK